MFGLMVFYAGRSSPEVEHPIMDGVTQTPAKKLILVGIILVFIVFFNVFLTGYRMPLPDNTPDEMYRLMLKCWEYKPENRPNFEQIYTVVETLSGAYTVSFL